MFGLLSIFWNECNIGESDKDVTAFLTADSLSLGQQGKSRLVKAGMIFDRCSISHHPYLQVCGHL